MEKHIELELIQIVLWLERENRGKLWLWLINQPRLRKIVVPVMPDAYRVLHLASSEIRKDFEKTDKLHICQPMFCTIVAAPSKYAAWNLAKILRTWRYEEQSVKDGWNSWPTQPRPKPSITASKMYLMRIVRNSTMRCCSSVCPIIDALLNDKISPHMHVRMCVCVCVCV